MSSPNVSTGLTPKKRANQSADQPQTLSCKTLGVAGWPLKAATALLVLLGTGCGNPSPQATSAPSTQASNQLPTVVSTQRNQKVIVQNQGQEQSVTLACVAVPPQPAADTTLLSTLLPAGQAVQVRDVSVASQNQRRAELFLGNEPVGVRLVQQGAATVDPAVETECPNTASRYWRAQSEAQLAERGLWQQSGQAATAATTVPVDVPTNVQLPVQSTAGVCPQSIGLWAFRWGFEGGADHTVVADLPAVASSPVQLLTATDQELAFTAPLRPEYAQCEGVAQSPEMAMYRAELGQGQVRFYLDLSGDGAREVLYQDISASRPYIRWQATE